MRWESTLLTAQGELRGAFTLALEGDATILVANPTDTGGIGRLIRITRRSGTQSIVSQGGAFVDPFGVVVV